MASKERPTLHLKKTPDFPPKPPVNNEESFNSSDELRRANNILNDLRQDIFVAGSDTKKVEKEWKNAIKTHNSIVRSVKEYQATTNPEEKNKLEESIKKSIASLAYEREVEIREAYQGGDFIPLNPHDPQTALENREEYRTFIKEKNEVNTSEEPEDVPSPEIEAEVHEEITAPEEIVEADENDTVVPFPTQPRVRVRENVQPYTPAIQAETVIETEKESDEPIVMLNKTLNKIAGLKEKKVKKEKPRKVFKSVSEGGTVYKGHQFDSLDGESGTVAPKAETAPEPVIIRGAPETRAEYMSVLRRNVAQIDHDIEAKRRIIESLEKTALQHTGIRETESARASVGKNEEERFMARNHRVEASVDDQIRLTEKELTALYDEKQNSIKTESASNENSSAEEAIEAPLPVVEVPIEAQDWTTHGPNIKSLSAEREARIKEKNTKKKQNMFRTALAGLMAFAGFGEPEKLAAATHAPTPVASRAFNASVQNDPALHHLQEAARVAAAEKSHPSTVATIEKNGEGADALIGSLKAKLKVQYPEGTRPPNAVVKQIIEMHPHMLTEKLKGMHGKKSVPMHMKDSLEVNAKGQLVFHSATHHADHPQVLMESTIAGVKWTGTFHWPHVPAAHKEHKAPAAPHHAETVTPEAPTAPHTESAPGTPAPSHEQTPAAPAPDEVPSPVAPVAHPETKPTQGAKAENIHGLFVDKETPHIYQDAYGALIAFGGSSEQQLKMINDFFESPSNWGKTILAMTSKPDPLTGQPDLSSFSVDESGKTRLVPVMTDEQNTMILPPTEDDLVKKVQ
ncbi:MAG: hypothetical protein JWM39_538 [Parcubacteria group bacterium]|nr:hypothetical protein [Parcubacteria group bacterium]